MSGNKSVNELNDLLEKMQSGDPDAFEAIYKRCRGHITFVCSQLCQNREDVEEIVQDTFMEIYKKSGELRGDTFLALLRKIAARMCYRKHKANQGEYEHLAYNDNVLEMTVQKQEFLPEIYVQNKELREELSRVVEALPAKQRKLVYLYYYADINTEAIARLLGCPPGNVRKTLHVARNNIKSKLPVSMAGLPIGTILFMQEELFVETYLSLGAEVALGLSTTAAATAGAATGANIGIIAACACAVTIGAAAIAAYFVLAPTAQVYEAPPATTVYTQQAETPPTMPIYVEYEPKPEEHSLPTDDPTEATAETTAQEPMPHTDTPAAAENEPPPAYTPLADPPAMAYRPDTPTMAEPEAPTPPPDNPTLPMDDPTPPPDNATSSSPVGDAPALSATPNLSVPPPTTPNLNIPPPLTNNDNQPTPPTDEPTDKPTPHIPDPPVAPDRTAKILAALAAANTSGQVNHIINTFGFTRVAQVRVSTGDTWFWFYVTDEGSGDILVGTTEDGDHWHMRYEHFDGRQSPRDRADLFDWMEG